MDVEGTVGGRDLETRMWRELWGKGIWKELCGKGCGEGDMGRILGRMRCGGKYEERDVKEMWRELCGKACGEGNMGRGLRGKGCGNKDVEGTVWKLSLIHI